MKYLISPFLWLLGFLYFSFFLFFALLVSYILPERIYNPWITAILRGLFPVIFTKVEVEGRDAIDLNKTYLYMSNHVSTFDIPLLGGFVPGFARGVEAHRQHKWPLYGWVMGRLGNIPIERENIHGSISSLRFAAKQMIGGKSIIILPEGHRTMTGKLGPFKKLPFLLAKQADKEIIPVGISGLFHLNRKGSLFIQPTTLKIKFGKVIPIDVIENKSVIELRDIVREEVEKLIERP